MVKISVEHKAIRINSHDVKEVTNAPQKPLFRQNAEYEIHDSAMPIISKRFLNLSFILNIFQ